MANMKLSAPKVLAFKCPADKQQVFMWDSDTAGLGVRATSGSMAYIFQSRFQGATIRITIGDTAAWSLNSQTSKSGKGGQIIKLGAREEARA